MRLPSLLRILAAVSCVATVGASRDRLAGGLDRPLAGGHARANGRVHEPRARRPQRHRRPAARRPDDARAAPLERLGPRPRDGVVDAATGLGRCHRRRQRRLLAVRQRAGERDLHATRRPRGQPQRAAVERRGAHGRDARHPEDRATRDVGRHHRPSARRAQRSACRRQCGRLHGRLRPGNACGAGLDGGGALPVPARHARCRPHGERRRGRPGRCAAADSPRRRRARRIGRPGCRARHRGGRRRDAPDAVRLRPGLARRRGGRRRRPRACPWRKSRRQPERVVHAPPAPPPRAAERRRTAAERPHPPRRGRRPTARVQHGPHERRARKDDGPTRGRPRDGVRRRRVDDARVRRRRPQQAFRRARARRRLRPRVPLRGRVPAAPRRAGLTQR